MTFTLLPVLLCVLIALIVRLSRLAKARRFAENERALNIAREAAERARRELEARNRIISQRARADRRKPRA